MHVCRCSTLPLQYLLYQLFKVIQSQSAVSAFLGVIGQISGNGSDPCEIPPKKTLHECITTNQTTTYLAGHSKNFKGIFLSFTVRVVIALCVGQYGLQCLNLHLVSLLVTYNHVPPAAPDNVPISFGLSHLRTTGHKMKITVAMSG